MVNKIRKLIHGQVNSLTGAALLVALSSLISRFLGIFRDRILAGEFGAGDTLDIYYAAFRIPDLIFNLLILGALSAGFIPIFTSLIKKEENVNLSINSVGEGAREDASRHSIEKLNSSSTQEDFRLTDGKTNEGAWELASNVLNILGIFLIFLTFIGILTAPFLMRLITPGFTGEKMDLTIGLTRIMFLSPFFLGLSSVLGGMLQSFKRFFIYSLAPIFYNVGIILGAIYLVPIMGIRGLAWGVVIGAFLHMAIQIPTVFKLGFDYKFIFNWRDKLVLQIGRMMMPRTMSLAISQINLVVITIVASTLSSGSLTVFNFANNLQSFPIGIFGISFAVAAFPTIASVAFENKKLVENISQVLRQVLFFIVPSMVLLLTLRAQIIRVVLGTGQFNWEDTVLTLNTLGFFSISLFAQALVPILVRVFYARRDSKTPFLIGLVAAVINVILSYWLSKTMGVTGLALAFSVANIINFVLLWLILHSKLGSLDEMKILFSTIKFSSAAVVSGIVVQLSKSLVVPYVDMTKTWGVFTQGLVAGTLGFAAYILICFILQSEELFYFWAGLKRRLPWKKIETGDQGEARGI